MPEEPADELGAETDPFGVDDQDDTPQSPATWLGAFGQMVAAVLVVAAVLALFITAAVVVRRLLP